MFCLADARRNFEKNSWNPKRESYCFYCWPLTQHFSAEIILKGNVTSSRKGQVVWNLREFQQEALEIFQHALTFIKRRNISQWLVAGAQGEELCDGRIDWNNCAVDGSVGFVWVCRVKGKSLCARWRCYLAEISSRVWLIDRCVSFRETRSVDRSQSWLRWRRVVWLKNLSSHLKSSFETVIMIRRSFQLSGSYDVIKDISDLESKYFKLKAVFSPFGCVLSFCILLNKKYLSWRFPFWVTWKQSAFVLSDSDTWYGMIW